MPRMETSSGVSATSERTSLPPGSASSSPVTGTLTYCESAWTPASVLPAQTSSQGRTPQLARNGPDAAGLLGEAGELRAAVAEPYDEGAAV